MSSEKKTKSLKEIGFNLGFYGFTDEALKAFKNIRENTGKIEKMCEEEGAGLFKENKISLEDKKALYLDLHCFGFEKVVEVLGRKLKGCLGAEADEELLEKVSHLIASEYTKPYFLGDNSRLKYFSDKGTPMFVDFNLFTKKYLPNLGWKIKDGKISWFNKSLTLNKFTNALDDYTNSRINSLLINWPDRETIESPKQKIQEAPAVEMPKTRILSKPEVYDLLMEGKTKEDIQRIDPSFSPNKIRAYKAHITMDEKGIQKGRPKKQKLNELEEKTLSSEQLIQPAEKEELSKEDAIWLLKQGFSTKEILKNYPRAFSDYQLRGYKAHVTAGRL